MYHSMSYYSKLKVQCILLCAIILCDTIIHYLRYYTIIFHTITSYPLDNITYRMILHHIYIYMYSVLYCIILHPVISYHSITLSHII